MVEPEVYINGLHSHKLPSNIQPDLFCNANNYPWKWPSASILDQEILSLEELLGRFTWLRKCTPPHQEAFLRLYKDIYQQISLGLSEPCPVFRGGDTERIEFLGCVAWVIRVSDHTIHLELRDPGNSWKKSHLKINMHDPLENLFWLDQFMRYSSPEIEKSFGELASEASWNLQRLLALQFQKPEALHPTSRQIRHHFEASPKLITTIGHISRWSPTLQCNNESYAEFQKDESSWCNLSDHYRNLSHVYYLLQNHGLLERGANLSGLRKKCFELGLSQAGWRFLCKHGEMSYMAIFRRCEEEHLHLGVLVAYIDWQAKAGLERPFHSDFGKGLINNGCITEDDKGIHRVMIDPRLAQVGEEFARYPARENSTWWEWEQYSEWSVVIMWIRDHQPEFDKNQWSKGWKAIYQCFQQWMKAKIPEITWEQILGNIRHGKYLVKELANSTELEVESSRMHHCAVTYVDKCRKGEYIMFSVESISTGEPVATIGFVRKSNMWSLDQVKGKCNSDPCTKVETTTNEILDRLTNRID